MDKAKITKPKEQGTIQPSRSDNSGPTEILPSKNPNDAEDTKHQFALEEIVVAPEMPKATLTIIRPTTVQEEESFTGRTADLMESMKDKISVQNLL